MRGIVSNFHGMVVTPWAQLSPQKDIADSIKVAFGIGNLQLGFGHFYTPNSLQ